MPDYMKPLDDGTDGQWLRPKTTRRYLHPPKAERMFTLWAEGKIIFGEVTTGNCARDYLSCDCAGIWLVHSKHALPFDFRRAINFQGEKDVPIHGLTNSFGGFTVSMEAFCDIRRHCTCFSKIWVKNNAPYRVTEKIGLLVRSGKEKQLVHGSPDEYVSYMPEVSEFKYAPATFTQEQGILKDGDIFVTADSPAFMTFDEEHGILWINLDLDSGEETQVVLSFGKGTPFSFDYDSQRNKVISFWTKELSRIQNLPNQLQQNPELISILRRCVVQILQCCCYYKDTDYFVMRQGGLQRLIWPWEAMPAMEALGRLGDFSDYLEPILAFYFDMMHQPDGEIKTFGEGWASVTSSCLSSLATYCVQTENKSLWDRYRNKAMLTFDWIRNMRRKSAEIEGAEPGLFPPLRGNDNSSILQHWNNTDSFATYALGALAKAAAMFDDPQTDEVYAEYLDYKHTLKNIFDRYNLTYGIPGEKRVPLTPSGNDTAILNNFYPYLQQGAPLFAFADLITEDDVEQVKAYHVRVGLYKNGLYARMPYRNGNTHIWYTNATDYNWFRVWNHFDRREEMQQILDSQIRYSMTEEGYMVERYADNDPYYVPWSPNASACGRLINMLLTNYKD